MEGSLLILGTTFALVFPAELPDKTMLATVLLSTRYRSWPVLLGVVTAFAVQCLIAVAFGSVLTLLPGRLVALLACLLFALGAVLLLRHSATIDDDAGPPEGTGTPSWWRVAGLSFGVLFAAEWGDASQLATAALTARYGDPLSVGLGAWLALVTVATIAVLVGREFAARLRTTWLPRIASAVFAGFAVVAAVAAVLG